MNIPKKLEEKREELAERYSSMSYPALTRMHMSRDFHSGFNSACNLLLPEIEKLEEAMKFASAEDMWESDGEYVESFSYQYKEWYQDKLDKALKSLREFLGEENEGGDE